MTLTSHEILSTPTPTERLSNIALKLLEGNQDSAKQNSGHLDRVLLHFPTDNSGENISNLLITAPKSELTSKYDYVALLQVGNPDNPDGIPSYGVTIYRDGPVRIDYFDGQTGMTLASSEIAEMADWLESIESSLAPEA